MARSDLASFERATNMPFAADWSAASPAVPYDCRSQPRTRGLAGVGENRFSPVWQANVSSLADLARPTDAELVKPQQVWLPSCQFRDQRARAVHDKNAVIIAVLLVRNSAERRRSNRSPHSW